MYDYTPDRSAEGPLRMLEGYEGYLQADAYSGYDSLYAGKKIIEVGCWATRGGNSTTPGRAIR